MLLDEILVQIGEYGRFQKRVTFLIMIIAAMSALTTFSTVFLSAKTDHWCSPDVEINCTAIGFNNYKQCNEFIKKATIPSSEKNGEVVYEQCLQYTLSETDIYEQDANMMVNSTSTEACQAGWEYDRSQFKSTTVQEVSILFVFLHFLPSGFNPHISS